MPLPASGQRIGKTRSGRSWEKASVAPVARRMLFQATGINSAAAADENGAAAVIAQNRVQARLVALCAMIPNPDAAPGLTMPTPFTWCREAKVPVSETAGLGAVK